MSHRLSYVPWSCSLLLLRGLGRRLLGCSLCRWLLDRSLGCSLLSWSRFLSWSSLLLRRSLLRRWLLRRLRLGLGFIGFSLIGLNLLRLRARHLGLRRLLAVGEDLGDAEQRQILAMPPLAAVVLAALLLKHDDLATASLLHHLGGNQRASNGRAARLRAVAAKQQHLADFDDIARLARDALDLDNVVRRHAILLAARANDREHVSLSSLTLGLESRPCLGRLGRGPEKMAGSEAQRAHPAKRRTI